MNRSTTINKNWIIIFIIFAIFLTAVFILAYSGIVATTLRYIPFYDAIGHFVLFGLLGYLGYRATNRKKIKSIPLAPFIVTIFAIVEEFAQLLSPNRSFSFEDLFWGLLGIWALYLLDKFLKRKK